MLNLKNLLKLCQLFGGTAAGNPEGLYKLSTRLTEMIINGMILKNLENHMNESDRELLNEGTINDPAVVAKIIGNQKSAIKQICNFIYVDEKRFDFSPTFYKTAHDLLFKHTRWQKAGATWQILPSGEYKEYPNTLKNGEGHQHFYCHPELVPHAMQTMTEEIKSMEESAINPIVIAAWMHMEMVKIHPFADGNGRVARLAASAQLMRNNLPPLVVKTGDRMEYMDACREAEGGAPNLDSLIMFIQNSTKELVNDISSKVLKL